MSLPLFIPPLPILRQFTLVFLSQPLVRKTTYHVVLTFDQDSGWYIHDTGRCLHDSGRYVGESPRCGGINFFRYQRFTNLDFFIIPSIVTLFGTCPHHPSILRLSPRKAFQKLRRHEDKIDRRLCSGAFRVVAISLWFLFVCR